LVPVHVKGLVLGAPPDHWDGVVYVTSVEEFTTADYAAMVRAGHPSSESFTNKNWDLVAQDVVSHWGAAVDIVGVVAEVDAGDDGSSGTEPAGWAAWKMDVNGGPENNGYTVACSTWLKLDPTLIKNGTIVRVKGLVLGLGETDWEAFVFVTAVEKSSAAALPKPATTSDGT